MLASGCGTVHLPSFRLPSVSGHGWVADEATFAAKEHETFTVPLDRDGKPTTTVIGRARTFRIRNDDTLLDVARYYDIGNDEMLQANPGVDAWLPPVGSTVTIPSTWVLPCCSYEGIVLNIPEMRLFFYRRDRKNLLVDTYPVGLGRVDRRTPRGRATVITKTVNPRWNIPESIRQEHIRERGDPRKSIAGGDPDNPLGKYRLGLSIRPYSIHGTNTPWGTGSAVSHGCARLYPEDIERLFPLVAVGTPVEFVYQAVKVGMRDGRVYVEAHPDLYRLDAQRSAYDATLTRLKQRGLDGRVDPALIRTSLHEARGLPIQISD